MIFRVSGPENILVHSYFFILRELLFANAITIKTIIRLMKKFVHCTYIINNHVIEMVEEYRSLGRTECKENKLKISIII